MKYSRLLKAYSISHPFVQDLINHWTNYLQTNTDTRDVQENNIVFDFLFQLDLPMNEATQAVAQVFGVDTDQAYNIIHRQIEKNGWSNMLPDEGY